MTAKRNVLLLCLGLLVLGGGCFEFQLIAAQRDRLRTAQAGTKLQSDGVAAMRIAREASLRRLQEAETDLAALQARAATTESNPDSARELEVGSWLLRVKKLREQVDRQPAQQIPELRLLTDGDWLRVTRNASLDSPDQMRKALASLRSAAKGEFSRRMADALMKFTKTSGGALPASTLELAPYFTPPADPAMLERYEMVQKSKAASGRNPYIAIQEKLPVDDEYDDRFSVQPTGGWGSSGGPAAWMDDAVEQLQRAYQEYVRANGRDPQSVAQVIPLINPPLSAAQVEKLLKMDRDRKR